MVVRHDLSPAGVSCQPIREEKLSVSVA